jgi:SAM-dependent methyltransferase
MRKTLVVKPEEDALGEEIWAFYQGRDVFEIWERDDGYISAYSSEPKRYFLEYPDWFRHEKKAMEFVKGNVLDVGCGAGRHSLYLQEKGFEVLGIDVSPLAVKVCKLRGVKRAEVMSIEDLVFEADSFDTVLMLGNNFSLFGGFKKARRLLKKLHRITSRDALIIAETVDPYQTDKPAYLEYYELNRKKNRMSGQLRGRVRFEKFASKWFDWLMVSKEEMKQILNTTGWEVREFIDSESSQYIAIIEKIT